MVLAHVLFQFLLHSSANMYHRAAHLGAAERLLVSVKMLRKSSFTGEALMEIKACMT